MFLFELLRKLAVKQINIPEESYTIVITITGLR